MRIQALAPVLLALCCTSLAKAVQDSDQPLPFRAAIELAARNSAVSGAARADLQRARAGVSQAKDFYIPQVVFGSGLGASYGFPLSLEGAAPSIFNVNLQGGLWNMAQKEYIKAAQSDVDLTLAQNADRRNDVIMETALYYMQLDLLDSSLSVQQQQQAAAARYQDITDQRVEAGVDSHVELTRAKLAVARTRLDIARTRAAADQLRLRLSQLTGLPLKAIRTSTESIPKLPEISQDDDLAAEAAQTNPQVKIAEDMAESKAHKAEAERKQLYPAIDLVGQYAMLARYNNYDQFFNKFQRNNVTGGVSIRVPFFSTAQRKAADVARFDAVKAREDALNVKQQVSADTLKLQREVEELAAARDVAELEHELSQADIEAAQAKIQSGQATLKDEVNARITEHERYTDFLSSSFDLDKAEVQLLRQIGSLEEWALGPKK
ncbi:MAG TPA: TolC family protein [Candidatus Angelobacter sp.]|nr:TolC family protein [Candidatus Angelobacter sp.]